MRPCHGVRAAPIVPRMNKACFRAMLLLAIGGLSGACAPLPGIAPLADSAAPAPQLVPLQPLLATVAPAQATEAAADALAARATRLQARARLMRAPVLPPQTRSRLAAAIARGAA